MKLVRTLALATALAFLGAPTLDATPKSPTTHSQHKPKQKRSHAVREAFKRQTGYPHGRPGYVIDHIVPLACGGADATWNMQWSTIAEGKAKDKWERKGC